ncbi:MAG: transcription termination/antitermination protein NusA [Bacteroidetes bacterium GWE2_29_8]|nr:MAG: transcription termination/antitermination protein NusA [Bacteroidetes bacterium GWE2_29_8]OFY18369.1 MAG: transcription termination/antitermination protein NusA [Bacteroidetes bacterium GWF2_29_10]
MKKGKIQEAGINLVESFSEFKEFKNIDKTTLMSILEEVFRSMILKKYGTDENIDFVINIDRGALEIWRNRKIVEDDEFEDEILEIPYSEAIKIEPDFELGEEISEPIQMDDFDRRSILSLRHNLATKIQSIEKEEVFKFYKDRIGDLLTVEVYQVLKREIIVQDDDGNELILPKSEQIPADHYRKGDSLRAVIINAEMRNGSPAIIISRTSSLFLEKLFETEVPEIFDGLITIKKIVRVPGERAKVAVESYDDRIDPVGACVGMKGSRIHGIVRELRNENIDVINYTTNPSLYISRSLSPAKISSINIISSEGVLKADVYLKPEQVSLAIGKNGYNIKLASKLTEYEIDVYRDTDEDVDDVDLDEFGDEIESWIIDELKQIGCDTAKSVINLGVEDLVNRTDLEEETIIEVIRVLKEEFE